MDHYYFNKSRETNAPTDLVALHDFLFLFACFCFFFLQKRDARNHPADRRSRTASQGSLSPYYDRERFDDVDDNGYEHSRGGNYYARHGHDDYDIGNSDDHYYRHQYSRSEDGSVEAGRRHREGSDNDDGDLDEFGRRNRKPEKKSRREWPPCFDTAGSAFVFDARSGMFYEAESDFFYDPKTKLYFGNKKSTYYSYAGKDEKPPFKEVQKVTLPSAADSIGQPGVEPEALLGDSHKRNSSLGGGKPAISIKLKTKKLSKKAKDKSKGKGENGNNEDQPLPLPTSNILQKQHQADINKWSELQVGKKEETSNLGEAASSSQPVGVTSQKQEKVAKTAKGAFVCLLCRRKFATLEKLRYHERASALHKENLAKKEAAKGNAAAKASVAKESTAYVDRAQQRRILHGPGAEPMCALLPTAELSLDNSVKATAPQKTEVRPQDSLGETNIGNQLLQKQGWKTGQSLGRQEREGGQQQPHDSIKKQWERIESLAATNGGR